MDDAFLATLRCPIDPERTSSLKRERDQLLCEQCAVKFPIRNGIPVLISEEADLPADCTSRHQLPCRRSLKDRS